MENSTKSASPSPPMENANDDLATLVSIDIGDERISQETLRNGRNLMEDSGRRPSMAAQRTVNPPRLSMSILNRALPALPFGLFRQSTDGNDIGLPPPYEPGSQPPPEYHSSENVNTDNNFESSELGKIKPFGLRWWTVGTIFAGIQVFGTLLLLLTLAKVSTDPGRLSVAGVILPFVYVFFAAYGKVAINRDRSNGKSIYLVVYVLRWLTDLIGLSLIIRVALLASDADESTTLFRNLQTESTTESQPTIDWTTEFGRFWVVGMRLAQYGELENTCAPGRCTWRAGVYSALLVIHFVLGLLIAFRLREEFRHQRQTKTIQDPESHDHRHVDTIMEEVGDHAFFSSSTYRRSAIASPYGDPLGLSPDMSHDLNSSQTAFLQDELLNRVRPGSFAVSQSPILPATFHAGVAMSPLISPAVSPTRRSGVVHFDWELFRSRAYVYDTDVAVRNGTDVPEDERPLSWILHGIGEQRRRESAVLCSDPVDMDVTDSPIERDNAVDDALAVEEEDARPLSEVLHQIASRRTRRATRQTVPFASMCQEKGPFCLP
ncbi:uncharacterized protein EV422DRAFT_512091 [Fimicolochytrium jonesii]|uniref:uncharacterized protein n=1 Tax=Fimicolochytrium jonesii TaxID=1396493 RepID=UPI0022FDC900|nr:uncharacterized protein EV422DRAFT_512091 [Fimicolochytrium jonesii]KAI8826961.1 hypothetical protein EV422DRAFT_512091 [Fimicolochytrium jonesii]